MARPCARIACSRRAAPARRGRADRQGGARGAEVQPTSMALARRARRRGVLGKSLR